MKVKSVSPSRLKTFDMCHFKYWLTYHARAKMKSNWGAAHGSLLHDILEAYVKDGVTDWRDRLYRGYQGILETRNRFGNMETMESPLVWAKPKEYAEKPPVCDTCPYADTENNRCGISYKPLDNLPGCPKDLFDGSVKMLEDVFRRYDAIFADPGRIIEAEYECKLELPGMDVPFMGIMDLVYEIDEDTVCVLDYKSGSWTQDFDQLREDLQAQSYFMAGYKEFIEDQSGKGFKYKNLIVTFDYFLTSPVTVSFTAEERKATEDFIVRETNRIKATTSVHRVIGKRDFNWKCRALCDNMVCAQKWRELEEAGRIRPDGSFEETES